MTNPKQPHDTYTLMMMVVVVVDDSGEKGIKIIGGGIRDGT